jgi:hypothetical protein
MKCSRKSSKKEKLDTTRVHVHLKDYTLETSKNDLGHGMRIHKNLADVAGKVDKTKKRHSGVRKNSAL